MKPTPTRLLLAALLVSAAATVASCGDRTTTGPAARSGMALVKTGGTTSVDTTPTGLLQCPLALSQADSLTVGAAGGRINVGPATLLIPPGALAATVTITVEVLARRVRAVRLRPAGLVFQQPAYLVMSYANCQTFGLGIPMQVAFTDDSLEILAFEPSWDVPQFKKVTGQLTHFSNYAVAW
jgi:hypothetical protein